MEDTSAKLPASGYRVVVHSGQVVMGFALVAVALLFVHAVITVYHYQVAEIDWLPWRQLFDVDEENNLPTWFSGFLLAATAFSVWVLANAKRGAGDRWAIQWKLLAFGFLLLSLDEVAGLHETVNSLITITWAIPGGILAVVVGLMFFPFLSSLPAATRNAFILAGAIFVGGAVGVEMIGEPMDSDSMLYNLTTVVEEGMEMGGVIVFLAAMFRYMAQQDGNAETINITVEVKEGTD